ncbi:Stealth CR1 domain-containing protein, partial [Escherichia coli]|nr:Stealth CR1 domain-containing protein [Escherichia coli]
MRNDIDVVITWVDGNEPDWIKEYTYYKGCEPGRFRDIGVLKYIFRSLEKNMPWVRKIHFVTNGQYPTWLNLEHPKIYFHAHKDFFIYKDALPVFNSNAIELNFANIPDLSERFILFNDDMLVLKQVKEERFFDNGLPVDYCKLSYPRKGRLYKWLKPQNYLACELINNNYLYLKNTRVNQINKKNLYNKDYNLSTNISNFIFSIFRKVKWFEVYHHPQPHLKSTWLDKTSELRNTVVRNTIYTKFRAKTDVSHYLYRYQNLLNNKFTPRQYNDHYSIYVKNVNEFNKNIKKYFSNT